MKRILLFTAVLFFSFLIFIKAQTPNRVTVNTVIVPPYSTKITDYLIYENRAVITVTAFGNAGTNFQIYFQGSVIGDNGVSIKTKDNYYPSKPFELQANIPKRMSGDDLRDYFDWDYVDIAGVSTQTIIRTNGIPEGNYKICFQAYDYLTRQPIGSEQCSAPIHVSDVNPPRLIAPMCDRAVNGQNPQSLIFSWVNSPGAPINTQFTLTVLELYEGQNPNDAFATNTIPYFEKTINSPTYLYNAIDPELRAGKKYAWRVKATDPNDKVYFKNDGVSEVCTFDYKSSGKDSSQISKSDIQTNTGNSSISGKANYFFVEKKKVGNKKFGFGNSSTDADNRPENFPLKNTSIKLVEVYSICEVYKVKRAVSKDSKGKYTYALVDSLVSLGNSSIPLLSTKPDPKYPQTSNCGAIIAHTKTDDAGNFHFDIPSSFQSKILDTFSLGAAQATDGKSHHLAYATGLWVKYGSPYYYSGGTVFFIQGKILKDDANVYQQAKNYSLKVNLKNFAEQKNYYTGKITPIQGSYNYDVDVYVLKYKKSSGAPDNECGSDGKTSLITIDKRQYLVYAKKTAKMNSSVTFNDLIQNIYPADEMSAGDNYYIYAKPTDGKNVAYQPTKFSWNSCPFNDCFQDFQFDINMGNYVEQEMDLSPYQMSLAVSGKLKRVFANDDGSPNMNDAKPLANMPIKLVGQWVIKNDADGIVYPISGNSNDFAAGTTDGDGQFSLNTGNTTFYQLGENGMNQYQNSTGNFYDKNGNAKPVSGKEYYVLRIKVQSPYYYSPDNDLLVEPGYNYDLGDMLAYVREANVQVDGLKAVNTDLGINDVGGILNPIKKSGERVYLCVNPKKLPDGFPINENKLFGLSKKEIVDGLTYQVIDEATTTSGGKFLFKHVVLNDLQNAQDRYYYFTESTEQSFDNYSSEIINAFSAINDNDNEQKTFWNSTQFIKEYNAQKHLHQTTLTTSVYTWAQTPVIMGAVYPNSNYSTNPLQGVTVEVYDIPEAAVNESTFGNNGFSGAWFKGTICSKYGATPEASMQTGMNGKFQFNVNTNDKTKSGRKLVFFSKNGFTPTGVFVNGGAKIKRGEKAALSKIFMELPATVLGKVVDADDGNFIHAKVVVGDDFSWSETNETFGSIKVGDMFVPTLFAISQTLTMSAPYAKGVKFTAYPDDNDTYEPLTVYQDINFFGDQPKITFKLKHRQHHIIFKAHSPGSDYVANNIPVKATIINGSQQVTSIDETVWENDNNGTKHTVHRAKLEFASSAKTFLVKLESQTSGSCFESKIVSIDDDAKYTNIFNFELKPCKKVLCHVTDKGQPAVNVKIYVGDLPFTVPVAYTDINGDAELMGVPADGTHNIVAIPPITLKNYFGSTKAVNMSSYQGAKIKLTVSKFDMMDISSLLGFPIEVKNITFGIGPNTGKIFISGSMLVNNANNYFSIPSVLVTSSDAIKNNNFDFENIEIVASSQKAASGLPLAVPKNDFWSTTQSKNIKVFNSYGGFSYSGFGAFVKKLSDNSGKIQSPLFIDGANFKKGFSVKDAANSMYISTSNYSGKTLGYDVAEFLDLYNSDGTTPTSLTSSFKVSTWDYKNVWYLLHNKYAGEAKISGSTFDKDGLHLNTMLHTNIPQLASPDINVNVGNIDIDKNETHGASGSSLTIPMDKWKFAVKDWTLTSNGLNATGSIVAGALTVPANNVLIDYSRFNYGTYDVEKIKLGGNIPLNLDKNNTSVSFGFDAGYGTNGAWSLSMLPLKGDVLTSLNGLPGLASNDVINLKNVSLYSRGSDDENVIMLSETTPWVTVNSVSKFHPAMAFATNGSINFRGKLDLQIPKMSELTDAFTMRYEAVNGKLKLMPNDAPFSGLGLNTKGVVVNFNSSNQEFQNNNLVLHGKIKDQNSSVNYAFDVTLTKTNAVTTIAVDNTNQKFVYSGGTSGLEKITGSMHTMSNNTEWNNFAFEGDLFGLEGIADAKKHMNFTVKGDLVADNQKVGVKNVAVDGLGSGSITYDFGQKALIGSLHIEQDLSNCHLSSDVDLKFGGGDWYVFGSAIATNIQNSPVNSGKCGFFVGKGTISGNIQNVLAQYFYKNVLPDPFPKGSYTGALFCTEAAVPVPIIPQININLDPIVHCTLEHAIHLNSYTGISLDYPKISYDLGGQAYVYIHAGAGASIGIACCGADLSATGGAGVYGHIDLNIPSPSINPVKMMSDAKSAIMNANITMQGEVFLDLQGSAYVGGGLCDSDCDGWFCETTSWNKGMDIRLAATYKKGDGVKLEFKDLHFH